MRRVHHVIATREGLVGETTAAELRIRNDSVFVALPDPSALHHTVALIHGNTLLYAPVLDLGPWYTDDPYWRTERAIPRAEINAGEPLHGYAINGAGIDLSDGLIRRLGEDPLQWVNPRILWWWA